MKWHDILQVVRGLASRKGQFTSRDLASAAKMRLAVASGWLGKFARWGYVKRVGAVAMEEGSQRWLRLFELTRYGAKRPKSTGSPKWKKKRAKKQYRGGRQ